MAAIKVWIMAGKNYSRDSSNRIYHVLPSSTDQFQEKSPALREFFLPYMKSDEEQYVMNPREYVFFIDWFNDERKALERKGETQRGRDAGINAVTLYEVVERLHQGLQKARKMKAKVLIE